MMNQRRQPVATAVPVAETPRVATPPVAAKGIIAPQRGAVMFEPRDFIPSQHD